MALLGKSGVDDAEEFARWGNYGCETVMDLVETVRELRRALGICFDYWCDEMLAFTMPNKEEEDRAEVERIWEATK